MNIKKRHIAAAAALIGRSKKDLLVRQVARVIEFLENYYGEEIVDANDALALLRRAHVLPGNEFRKTRKGEIVGKTLLGTVKDCFPNAPAGPLTLCLAASIFPQRSQNQGVYDDLEMRLGAFVSFLNYYLETEDPIEAFKNILNEYISCADLQYLRPGLTKFHQFRDEIIRALAGVHDDKMEADFNTPGRKQWLLDRKNGAAFFLGTAHPELLGEIAENYETEKEFLKTYQYFPQPPNPDKPEERTMFGGQPGYPMVLELGRIVRHISFQYWPDMFRNPADQAEAWNDLFEKVINSGFPYYNLQRKLIFWLGKSLKHHAFGPRINQVGLDDGQAGELLGMKPLGDPYSYIDQDLEPDPEEGFEDNEEYFNDFDFGLGPDTEDLNPEDELIARIFGSGLNDLIVLREGYRLCRWTFSSRTNQRDETLVIRKVLDRLWKEYLEARMKGRQMPALQGIIAQFADDAGINPNTLWTSYFNRLQKRMFAYVLGRGNRLGSHSILIRRRPGAGPNAATLVGKNNLALDISMMAKTVDPELCFLGPFLAFILLRDQVGARHEDITFQDLIIEITFWVEHIFLVRRMARSACKGQRADLALVALVVQQWGQGGRFHSLIGLDEDEARKKLAKMDLDALCQTARDEARAAADCQELLVFPDQARCNQAKCTFTLQNVSPELRYLVLPIWYLIFIERLVWQEVDLQLVLDRGERKPGKLIYNKLEQCHCSNHGFTKKPSGGKRNGT